MPNGSGTIWAYGVYNYHAVDSNTAYIPATNRGLNFFTDGISGHKVAPPHTIEQGLRNGTIFALDLATGNIKWQFDIEFPPRVSPIVTDSILFCGYIPFTDKAKSGVILALDKESGRKLWEYNTNAPIGPVGPSIGNGMLFVPTGKVQGMPNEVKHGGSIIAFGLPWLDKIHINFIIFNINKMDIFDDIEITIIASTMMLAIILSMLSITGYRKNKLKKMLYAAIAFGLFAIFALYQYVEENYLEANVIETIDNPATDLILPAIPLVILLLFFLALIKKT
jgi:hypothetical protein